ncbi:MAG: hypothetical protein HQ551_09030 [Desulfobacteraceae bacterium]|nr:hypothetical protein [Desulfobacteraceae bacterium]
MGISLRIFLVNDNDSIQRFPLARFERLIQRDPKERLPQYAGKRVRYVEVALELEQRKPIGILRILYLIMPFDSEGRVDATEQEKEQRLGIDMIPPMLPDRDSSQVVEARHRFAKKRFDNEYRWKPTQEIEFAIMKAIFGND